MPDTLHQPPAEIVARAHVNADQYAEMYAAFVADPDAFWGEHGKRLDWIKPFTRVKNTSLRLPRRLDQLVRGRHAQRLGQLHRPPPRRRRGDQTAIIWESDDPSVSRHITYRELHEEVSKFANVLHGARREEGRPGRPLPADDPGGRLRHARLRPHRRGPLGRLRRLLRRGAALAHRGFRRQARRSPPTRRRAAAAAPRSRPTPTRRVAELAGVRQLVVRRTGGDGRPGTRPRRLAARGDGPRPGRLPAGRRWAPRTRSSSSTPPAPPASRRACCTPPAATSSTPR